MCVWVCGHKHTCVCLRHYSGFIWFYLPWLPYRCMVFQSEFPGHSLHLTSLSPTRFPPWGIFPSPVSIYVLPILQDQFQMLCLPQVPDCLDHSFFLWIPITPPWYFSYAYHTPSYLICILFLLSYKLFGNINNFLCSFFLILPISILYKYYILNVIGGHKCVYNEEIKEW